MERYFYRRGEKVPVSEIKGLMAVNLGAEATRAERTLGDMAKLARGDEPAFTAPVPDEELDALASAGWVLARPERDFDSAARSLRGRGDVVQDVNQVFQQSDGHLLLGGRQMIVQLSPELSDKEARQELEKRKLSVVRELAFAPNQYQVELGPDQDLLEVANALQESEITVAAEPEFIEFIGQRLRPSDPSYAQQWQLNNPGGAGGVAGADIAAERAWDFTRGRGVRVAVIDNGFDVRHNDLAAGIVAESGFFDARGSFRQGLTGYPDDDHGTFCAGMVGARLNNGRDGCGSAPECELMLIATRNDQIGTQATLARALAYAADPRLEVAGADVSNGADVIVSSLGPNGAFWALTTVLENAILFASRRGRRGRGTPVFWASSNGNNVDITQDQVVSHPNVIAVGRSRRDDREDNSARGPTLDFLAPGVNVVSTASGGGTRMDTGTSFAAPLAAGVGALVLAINPDLEAEQVREVLRGTCDKVGGASYAPAGRNDDYGHGRVNAFRAVTRALQTIAVDGVRRSDVDGDRLAEFPVSSPWGIGTLEYRSGGIASLAMAANGNRFNGWLLNTTDNRFPAHGDFDGDGRAEMLVTSPWGLGILKRSGSSYQALMLAPNGTRFGGWLLNTADNRFGPVGDFDGDGRDEILVRSPWGIGLLRLGAGHQLQPLMMAPNGTRFGGWLLNTADNQFGPIGDFDGDGRDEIMVSSPWGIGILKYASGGLSAPMMAANGSRFGGWLLNTADNWLGPVGDFDGDGRAELMIGSPWGLGLLELAGSSLGALAMAANGTRFGGWLLNTFDNRVLAAADYDGDGRDELLITSPWGIGVLEWTSRGISSRMLKPNGTRFGGWLLNTADNQFRSYRDSTGDRRANILVESPWGIGLLGLAGDTFHAAAMAANGSRLGGWLLNTRDNRF
jgi:subtilisin family serine protease